jgi:hypothetical protein
LGWLVSWSGSGRKKEKVSSPPASKI